jgi:hypothetical protein
MNTKINKATNAILALVYALKYAFINEIQNNILSYLPMPAKKSGIADMRYVIYIIVAFLLVAILFPIAMAQVTAATTTSWGAGVAPIFSQLLPILVIISVAVHFFGLA